MKNKQEVSGIEKQNEQKVVLQSVSSSVILYVVMIISGSESFQGGLGRFMGGESHTMAVLVLALSSMTRIPQHTIITLSRRYPKVLKACKEEQFSYYQVCQLSRKKT